MDKELLFKPRLTEAEHEIPGVGTVRLRALSRPEVTEVRDRYMDGPDIEDLDVESYEVALVALSMVDPVLTEDEVRQWAAAAPAGELVDLIDAIRDLSAMGDEAAKSGVRANRQGRRAAARVGSRRKAR